MWRRRLRTCSARDLRPKPPATNSSLTSHLVFTTCPSSTLVRPPRPRSPSPDVGGAKGEPAVPPPREFPSMEAAAAYLASAASGLPPEGEIAESEFVGTAVEQHEEVWRVAGAGRGSAERGGSAWTQAAEPCLCAFFALTKYASPARICARATRSCMQIERHVTVTRTTETTATMLLQQVRGREPWGRRSTKKGAGRGGAARKGEGQEPTREGQTNLIVVLVASTPPPPALSVLYRVSRFAVLLAGSRLGMQYTENSSDGARANSECVRYRRSSTIFSFLLLPSLRPLYPSPHSPPGVPPPGSPASPTSVPAAASCSLHAAAYGWPRRTCAGACTRPGTGARRICGRAHLSHAAPRRQRQRRGVPDARRRCGRHHCRRPTDAPAQSGRGVARGASGRWHRLLSPSSCPHAARLVLSPRLPSPRGEERSSRTLPHALFELRQGQEISRVH